ncbi:MAG: hypothetical protein IJ772_04555 [Bacilli bacterium]|nr:hypothetical protein [Bacilli bacterium]
MLLIPYRYTAEKKLFDPESVKLADIVYRERNIYIIKLHEYDFGDSIFSGYQTNFVLLTNFSHTKEKDKKDIYTKNTYGFTYKSEKGKAIKEFMNAELKLIYATSIAYESYDEYYKDEYYNDLGMSFIDVAKEDPYEINLDDMCHTDDIESGVIKAPDPRYYTVKQYEIDNNKEFVNLIVDSRKTYKGNEIYDDCTKIMSLYLDKKEGYDDGIKMANGKGQLVPLNNKECMEHVEKMAILNDIPFSMFVPNMQSCFKGYKFIYDSKFGYNFKDINGYDKSIYRQSEYLKDISDRLRGISKRIEKNFGKIRLTYVFSDVEDCVEVIFDDEGGKKIRYNYNKNSTFDRIATYMTDKWEKKYEYYIKGYANKSPECWDL